MTQTVICIKWGTRYGADYVNRLASMIRRHTRRPTRLVCFTEDPRGIDPGVEVAPLPPIPNIPERVQWTGWRKIALWQYPLHNLEGDILFFDLDVVIAGNIDDFFDFEPGRYAVAENWSEIGQNIGNTSVYRFPAGKMAYIFDKFVQSSATKTGAGGTGLGLAITNEIIRGHQGSISASNHPDGGAIFTVRLQRTTWDED